MTKTLKKYADFINFGLALLAIILSIWGIISSESIAERSGTFDKPELSLSLGGHKLSTEEISEVYIGTKISEQSIDFATLPIDLHNNGMKAAEKVDLIIKYPHLSRIAVPDSIISLKVQSIDTVIRKFISAEPFDQVIFRFATINPMLSLNAKDLIALTQESRLTTNVSVPTKDNKILNFPISIDYAYQVHLAVSSVNFATSVHKLNLHVLNCTDINSLVKKIAKTKKTAKFYLIMPTIVSSSTTDGSTIRYLESDGATFLCTLNPHEKIVEVENQLGQKSIINL
ncbi:hypothetical protein GZH53_17375 [Flavihumibacter sp. R14]|nr:hypothetical protein [Flavihumibacter soli]